MLAATGIGALGNHLALTAGFGLSGLAAATGLAYAVYLVLLVAVSIWLELNRTERLRYLGVLILAIVPTLGLALTLEHHWPGVANPWTVTLGKTIAVTLIWTLTTLFGWTQFGWRDAFRNKRSCN